MDGMQGVAYENDKRVVSVTCKRFYAEQSKVVVEINEVEKNKK